MPHSECFIDGKFYPSVTTIIGAQPHPWLDSWRAKWGPLAERKTKIAGAIGTEFHRCVDQYLSTGQFEVGDGDSEFPTSCTSRVVGMMESFIDWAVNTEGEVHETELKVVSRLHTYSGTLDAVGTLEGKPIIYDWKTSSRIYDNMALQLAAYAQAYKETTGRTVKDGLIVLVSKDKPRFRVTTKSFRLGKQTFNKFIKLREAFDLAILPDFEEGGLNA